MIEQSVFFFNNKWNKNSILLHPHFPVINNQLPKVSSFNDSIQNIMMMINYYEKEEKKYGKKYTKCKLINNLINSTDGLLTIGTPSASVTLGITGVGIKLFQSLQALVVQLIFLLNLFQLFEEKGAKL